MFSVSEKLVRASLAAPAGLPASNFGLHSPGAGRATDMEASGATLSEIMHLGRWGTSAVLLYLRGCKALAQMLGAS